MYCCWRVGEEGQMEWTKLTFTENTDSAYFDSHSSDSSGRNKDKSLMLVWTNGNLHLCTALRLSLLLYGQLIDKM